MSTSIYSIGHGRKEISEFLTELQSFGIEYLLDVRSSPYSKWSPQFNQEALRIILTDAGIKYAYFGDSIGGRPTDPSCYDENGFFDYARMAQVPAFKAGLQRLVTANQQGNRLALMCSESDPSECHRSKLIGRELYVNYNIDMLHIIAPSKAITETTVVEQLTKHSWVPNLIFGEPMPTFKSRKSYINSNTEEDYD